MSKRQIVSRERVTDHGEVFTGIREVNAMLDLVKQEAERIDSRFLEPACGTGNFLTEILERKLRIVESRYRKNQLEYERYAILAVSSVYGIDILEDNIFECRRRLLEILNRHYSRLYGPSARAECLAAASYILEQNIICGDALTLKTVEESPQPIIFSQWSMVRGSMIKRRDFTFKELLSRADEKDLPLFAGQPGEAFIPEPVKEYPMIHFLRVADVEQP